MSAGDVAPAIEDADPFACVAVYEFSDDVEKVELYRGTEANCEALARKIEERKKIGRGLVYVGGRLDPPLHALTAVCRISQLADPDE